METTKMPRPEGVTYLCNQVHKAKSFKKKQERKQHLLKHLVNIYTISGFRLNGYPMSIAQFAMVLGTKQEKIQNLLFDKAYTLEAFSDPSKLADTANSLASMCTTWAIQDRGTIANQLELLLKSQGGSYKSFISGEVSKMIQNLMASNKNLTEVWKTFYSQGAGININIDNHKQENYLTIDKAYEIAKESQPQLLKPKDPKKAQILPESTLDQVSRMNDINRDSNILRQYEHLDNSGWEKNLSHHKTRLNSNIELAEVLEDKESISMSNHNCIDNDNLNSDSDFIEIDNETNTEMAKIDGKGIRKPAASKMGFLPVTEGPSVSGNQAGLDVQHPEGLLDNEAQFHNSGSDRTILEHMDGYPTESPLESLKALNPNPDKAPDPNPNPKPKKKKKVQGKPTSQSRTLQGSRLGKPIPQGKDQGSKEGKPDNLDRHLNSDKRRNIPTIHTDKLPNRS